MVLQLHLRGLENFKITSEQVTLEGSVSIQDGKTVVRLWKDGKENSPLNAKSSLWMDIRMVRSDGKPTTTIPLKDGYFEMRLPRAFFQGNPKSM